VTSTTSPTERVGRYQLLDPIGVGPSGAVSRAKVFGVAGFERQFAVKRFHAELTGTAAMAAMLSAAARAYGSLEHPRIARMSEFGVAQGSTFTAVEYVLGLDALRLVSEARLANVTLPAGGALALVSQAARAVGYAHGRGLTHLGLAPTNVIVTAEGDIKITDFGILSATLAQRPIEVPRLAQRIPYLAPEQLANEAPSAATDVFALGVLAYELVTGDRAFKGDTPQQVAAAIMAGPPSEPPLPRPIVRVLQRCLARSPFERFPDARALADALDAALRVAPVPGTRKEIGAQVKDTLDRLAALNEGQLSGVVALHLGTGPLRRTDDDPRRAPLASGREPETAHGLDGKATQQHVRSGPPGGGPATVTGGPATVTGGPATVGGPTTVGRPPTAGRPTTAGRPPTVNRPPAFGRPATDDGPPTVGGPLIIGRPTTSSDAPTIGGPLTSGRPTTSSDAPTVGAPLTSGRPLTGGRPSTVGAPPTVEGPTATLPDIPRYPMTTAPGVPPPPIPVPVGVGSPAAPSPPAQPGGGTLLGVGKSPSVVPPRLMPRPGSVSGVPPAKPAEVPAADVWVTTRPSTDLEIPIQPAATRAKTSAKIDAKIDALDPNDIEPIDSGLVNIVELDSFADGGSDEPAGAAADPPLAPAPALFDSIAQPSEPAIQLSVGSEVLTIEADDGFDDDVPGADSEYESARPTGAALASGQTIIGFGAPRQQPRAATSSAPMQIPPVATDREPAIGKGAALPPEGLRTAPDAAPTSPPAPHPDEATPDARPSRPTPEASRVPPGWVATPPLPVSAPAEAPPSAAPPSRRMTWIVIGVLGAALFGVGAWQAYLRMAVPDGGSARFVNAPSDAQPAVRPPADATDVAVTPDATSVATAPPDAGASPSDATLAPIDAAQAAAVVPGVPATTEDTLSIASTPRGARVFLDGSDTGTTPLKLPGSPDRHTIALLLAGHELYVAQVDGRGTLQIPLVEVTPSNGPAGIKVLRCKDKDRYYVFVDGKPTGQTCPTERIGCEVGPHTVEVYDIVSETRRKWDIVVKNTRLSFRVRVE
jgi:serine/threonine-protein kinase